MRCSCWRRAPSAASSAPSWRGGTRASTAPRLVELVADLRGFEHGVASLVVAPEGLRARDLLCDARERRRRLVDARIEPARGELGEGIRRIERREQAPPGHRVVAAAEPVLQ